MTEDRARGVADRISDHTWFHAIDFGSVQSPGRGDHPPNRSLFGTFDFLQHIELSGARCLDIGTMDGLAAFIMQGRGAAEVIATDLYDRPQFLLARELLGLDEKVRYLPNTHINDLGAEVGWGGMDMLVLAGVLYHSFSPLTALFTCRRLLKDGGLVIVETMSTRSDEPILILNPAADSPPVDEYTTYFVPSPKAVAGMLKLAGFEVLGSRQAIGRSRVTLLARATKPSLVPGRSKLMIEAHERLALMDDDLLRDGLDFQALEHGNSEPSSVRYSGPTGDHDFDDLFYEPTFQLQPAWEPQTNAALSWAPSSLKQLARRLRHLSWR